MGRFVDHAENGSGDAAWQMNEVMKAILICPEHRLTGGVFQRMKPLVLMPILGRTLLDHTLARLKRQGYTEVLVLASDRPEQVRESVGGGEAWGLEVEVIATPNELAADVAESQFSVRRANEPRPLVMVVDGLPEVLGKPLWRTNFATFELLMSAVSCPELSPLMTMRAIGPDVWVSSKARISPTAEITGPVWIGPHATISSGAKVGPNSIVEGGAFIDKRARVESAWVGPATYAGAGTAIAESFAWGNGLLNLTDGSFLEVKDDFLLKDLARPSRSRRRVSWVERMLAFLLMLLSFPKAGWVMLRSWVRREAVFDDKRVILPPTGRVDAFSRTYNLLRLNGAEGLLGRWPELWRVCRGELALVGNRPLSAEEVTALRGPVGQLWLESPAGVFSLADAEGADGESLSESLAHAAYFTSQRTLALRWRILRRCVRSFLFPEHQTQDLTLSPTYPTL
jgi:hypothetical protein